MAETPIFDALLHEQPAGMIKSAKEMRRLPSGKVEVFLFGVWEDVTAYTKKPMLVKRTKRETPE